MSPVECGDGIRLTTSAGEVVSYSLHNVVVHYGDTVEGGHYYTWVRLGPDSWSRISDNLVFNQQATAENLVFQGSHTPYVLFFERETNSDFQSSDEGVVSQAGEEKKKIHFNNELQVKYIEKSGKGRKLRQRSQEIKTEKLVVVEEIENEGKYLRKFILQMLNQATRVAEEAKAAEDAEKAAAEERERLQQIKKTEWSSLPHFRIKDRRSENAKNRWKKKKIEKLCERLRREGKQLHSDLS